MEFFRTTDKEHSDLIWAVYGTPPTNEIFVQATAGDGHFVKAAPSPLAYPLMQDRRFGIDIADNQLAKSLSNEVWQENKEAILAALRRG